MTQWQKAAGSCGFNVEVDVYAAYVNRVALFVFHSRVGYYSCVVTGHLSSRGDTLDEAQRVAEVLALDADPREADRKFTRKEFDALVADETRLPVFHLPH